ncbi:hypothetical protein [Streptomyces sp. INR7]|uniref:hypothetical protein n=1 Tax=Streptomyces TaxID=1883 RepID=UPI00162A5594|nr:hypothetical protein [Streptomyces sp. INR7]QNE28418.1 hypothetical protein F1D59_29685 [Streptomyces sp. INR7]
MGIGAFLLACGLISTTGGALVALDIRGAAVALERRADANALRDRLDRGSLEPAPILMTRPSPLSRTVFRCLGAAVALCGLALTVKSLLELAA